MSQNYKELGERVSQLPQARFRKGVNIVNGLVDTLVHQNLLPDMLPEETVVFEVDSLKVVREALEEQMGDIRVGTIAARLRDAKKLGLREAAARAGISSMHLSRIERGESSPTEDKIRGIAKAYGVPIAYLFGEIPEENPLDNAE